MSRGNVLREFIVVHSRELSLHLAPESRRFSIERGGEESLQMVLY